MEWIFCLSLGLLIYTFIGYPLCLVVVGKILNVFAAKTFASKTYSSETIVASVAEPILPTVDIILVTRNAEKHIEAKLASFKSLSYPAEKISLIVVLDKSEDSTLQKIQSFQSTSPFPITVIDNTEKTSKSACLNQAVSYAKAELLFFNDVRQTLNAEALTFLVEHFSDPKIAAVSGELVFQQPDQSHFSEGIDAYWRYEKFIRRSESKIASVPGVTGAIYAMRRSEYEDIPASTLLDDVLIPMNAILKGKRVTFESRAQAYDLPSSNADAEKQRKTRTLAGNWQLLFLRPAVMNPFKNGIWLQYVSHKALRLICPLLLASALISSFLLQADHWFYQMSFIAQLAFYASLSLAWVFPSLLNIRLIKLSHSFFMLMLFTAAGFWMFVRGDHLKLWR